MATNSAAKIPSIYLSIIILILLIGAFGRLWHLSEAPPGLQHDEVFKAQDAYGLIHEGDIRLFYPSNQGHEGGYVWLIAIAYLITGTSLLTIKMPAFWCGMLTIAMLYRVAGDVFNRRVAVIAAAFAAISFWSVFTNRVGLRANLLPLVTLFILWGAWYVYLKPAAHHRKLMAIITGGVLGYAIYTYTSAIALYPAFGGFLLGLALVRWKQFKQRIPDMLLMSVVTAILILPMIYIRLTTDIGKDRARTISAPYYELRDGNPDWVVENAKKLLTMPIASGDPEWRYNIKDRPLFLPVVGVLVYAGAGLLFWRSFRYPLNSLLLGLLLLGLVPSLLTISAPSFLRSIGVMPVIFLSIAIVMDWIIAHWRWLGWAVAVTVILITWVVDWNAYFNTWASEPEVYAIYRDDLEQLSRFTRHEESDLLLVTTDEPAFLDPIIYAYYKPDEQVDICWFDGGLAFVVPNDEAAQLLVSPYSPLTTSFASRLTADFDVIELAPLLRQDGEIAFYRYQLPHTLLQDRVQAAENNPVYRSPGVSFPSYNLNDWGIQESLPINIGNVIQLVGYEMPRTTIPAVDNRVDNGLNLYLYLRPMVDDLNKPITLFAHILRLDGSYAAGRDLLGVPPTSWNPGVMFFQDNYIGGYNLEPGLYIVTVGIYDQTTGERYPVYSPDGDMIGDRVVLAIIEAQ